MAKLKYKEKPIWRETNTTVFSSGKERPILIAIQPESLLLRTKGSHDFLSLPWGTAFNKAAMINSVQRIRKSVKRGISSFGNNDL
jgi:hypothetical protein